MISAVNELLLVTVAVVAVELGGHGDGGWRLWLAVVAVCVVARVGQRLHL